MTGNELWLIDAHGRKTGERLAAACLSGRSSQVMESVLWFFALTVCKAYTRYLVYSGVHSRTLVYSGVRVSSLLQPVYQWVYRDGKQAHL